MNIPQDRHFYRRKVKQALHDHKNIVVAPDGTITPFTFIGKRPSLEEQQKAVGGYIQYVKTDLKFHYMIVDEEGLINNKLVNLYGTAFYFGNTPIVGTILFLENKHCH